MRTTRTAAIVIGTLLALPATGLAAQYGSAAQPQRAASDISSAVPVHLRTAKGVVKSVDATEIEIREMPPYGRSVRFALSPSTEREGNVRVGATVEVRYRTEADQRIATMVTVERGKLPPLAPESHL